MAIGPILLVDDELVACDACAVALRKTGMEVDTAYSFEGALRRIRKRTYAAVVLEFNLRSESGLRPRSGSGLSLLRRITKVRPGVRTLVWTAMDGDLYRTAALEAGAGEYLIKTQGIASVLRVLHISVACGEFL